MVCCGKATWKREEVADHKFDFIDVRDYYSNTFFTRLRYMWVFIMVGKGFAVYIADIYTAITLLAFHRFNGSIYTRVEADSDNPLRVPFDYGRWIFTGCIIFSFCLLAYEAHKARAVVRSRDISYAYTNVMANDYYSIRSYNHFCFFCQINNSKKKKDELAFFIFFTFKGWKRLLVADGPRQVINALTLYALARAANFSTDLYQYYEGNYFTAAMLLTMLFTVVIFAGSAVLLALACLMYLPLICYIQGNLKEYCCHKIDKRISELVQKKKKQRLGKYAAIARAEAAGDFSHLMNKRGIIVGQKMVQPTLPNLDVDLYNDDAKPMKQFGQQRTASMSSSTVNGLHGPDKGLYAMKEGDDYGSTAHLMFNQGYAGSIHGHPMHGSNLSVSSGTLNASQPPTMNNSPDAYPVHVRGRAGTGTLDGQMTDGSLPMGKVLAQMGPIGTSPSLFAQRKVGMNGSQNGASTDQYGQRSQNGYYSTPYETEHSSRSATNDAYGDHNSGANSHEAYEMQSQGGQNGMNDHTYGYPPSEGMRYPDADGGVGGHDLSAYTPYQADQGGQSNQQAYLQPSNQGVAGGGSSHGNSRVQSFAFGDVYDDYLEEPGQNVDRDSYGQASQEHHVTSETFGYRNSGHLPNEQQQAYRQQQNYDQQHYQHAYSHDTQQMNNQDHGYSTDRSQHLNPRYGGPGDGYSDRQGSYSPNGYDGNSGQYMNNQGSHNQQYSYQNQGYDNHPASYENANSFAR
ncbi:uncharacterized protein FA14DRAFT_160744 [Meira miltonrushii]|uniref:Vacuole protein n=1 Tax=Meira miltonrushii TaxID=1280837 RepID=A0A316VDY4_9BASI|nr:uncharacterized protein FA14DRAFT_160744 [Meira miltonrushii]PWN35710.1 hypothetical protein FA14DRAFT_160744 [Meira miltonrushii]